MNGKIALIALFALAIALSGCTQPVSCTEEAKECPDGSFVSRNPALNCEFDACPALECRGEGETIPVIASPPECCPGLELIPPKQANIVGISGTCTAKCGDGICDTAIESALNCQKDCSAGGPQYECGDGLCQEWELTESHPGYCPQDCIEGTCQIGLVYENTALSPVSCACPQGYEFQVLETGFGPCPQEGMSDCPSSMLTCVES